MSLVRKKGEEEEDSAYCNIVLMTWNVYQTVYTSLTLSINPS